MEFPRSEYEQRVERALALMEEHGLDALMITGDFTASQNYRYFSGHVPRDFQANSARPHIFVLTKEGKTALCVHFFSEGPARQTWVEDIHVYTQPFGSKDLLTVLERAGVSSGTVGAELGLDQRMMMPVGDYEAAKDALPNCRFTDAGPLIWKLRMVKSPAEVEAITEADRINNEALQATFAEASIGMTEREIYDICAKALIANGSNLPPFSQMTISSSLRHKGKGMITPFSGPTDEPLGEGDVVFIDSGAVHRGYWGEFNRMAVMGEPTDDQMHWHELTRRIVRRSIDEVLRPGITCDAAMRECFALYEEEGVGDARQLAAYREYPFFHICHGLGLHSSELPLVRLTDDTVIEAGMVFSVEAYLTSDDMRYGSEEDALVTDNGCRILSQPTDDGLFVIR
jgi:Xaa-Pro dipeptidase